MTSSPETSRLNGAKSKGPKTERGKAITARNATKHGLLAKNPPLLMSEDLSTFEGLHQGLVEYYAPQNPVERFLVQQVAMGMLRQYRYWEAETAIANLEILRYQKETQFPDWVKPNPQWNQESLEMYQDTRRTRRGQLENERQQLALLVEVLKQENRLARGSDNIQESLGKIINWLDSCKREEFSGGVWETVNSLYVLCQQWLGLGVIPEKERIEQWLERIIALAQERLVEVNRDVRAIAALEEQINAAQVTRLGIERPEYLSRYQREINRDLYEAIDRLEKMQRQRGEGDSTGSFRRLQ